MNNNIVPQTFSITRKERNKLYGHPSFVIWFTGLSGSGKSTIANSVEKELFKRKIHTISLDGDNIRDGLNKGLGFEKEERKENLRRIAEVAKLFVESGLVVVASFISPLKSDRKLIKKIIGEEDFIEIYINTSLEECERRDVKGLYEKARRGEIKNFTGIDAPYEDPIDPDLMIKTETQSPEESTATIVKFLKNKIQLPNYE